MSETATGPVTPLEIKAVWEATPKPSARKVAERMTAAGRKVAFKTVAKWKRQNWGLTPEAVAADAIKAKDKIDQAAAVVTKDPKATAETAEQVIPPLDPRTTNADLAEKTLREIIHAAQNLAVLTQRTAPIQILTPDVIAKGLGGITDSVTRAIEGLTKLPSIREGALQTGQEARPAENTALLALLTNGPPKKDAADAKERPATEH